MTQVYFVQCGATRMIKIGISTDPFKRLAKMQSDAPGALTLLGIEPGDERRERELHSRFAADRERGEWFRPGNALVAYVATLAVPIVPKRKHHTIPGTTLHDRALGKAIGLGLTVCHQMRRGSRPILLRHALALHAFNGDKIGPLYNATPEELAILHRYVSAETDDRNRINRRPEGVAA